MKRFLGILCISLATNLTVLISDLSAASGRVRNIKSLFLVDPCKNQMIDGLDMTGKCSLETDIFLPDDQNIPLALTALKKRHICTLRINEYKMASNQEKTFKINYELIDKTPSLHLWDIEIGIPSMNLKVFSDVYAPDSGKPGDPAIIQIVVVQEISDTKVVDTAHSEEGQAIVAKFNLENSDVYREIHASCEPN